MKPDIVFFGEMLPERFHSLADRDFAQADLLIIMGSSLVVQPFASLVDRCALLNSGVCSLKPSLEKLKCVTLFSRVRPNCTRLLINKEKVGMQDRLSRLLGLRQGLVFDTRSSHGGRDVAWIGDCDTGCQLLAEKLGWGVGFASHAILYRKFTDVIRFNCVSFQDELEALIKKEHERLDAENTSND